MDLIGLVRLMAMLILFKVVVRYKTDLGKVGEETYSINTNNESDAANKAYNKFDVWARKNKVYVVDKMAFIQ